MTRFSGQDLVCIRGERCVFSGLSFNLDAGGALVLTGPNGSGKSSLLRLMAGLLRPASGKIAWNGENTAEEPEVHNGRLHYVGHLDAVKPVLSVRENLSFWAALRGAESNVDGALKAFAIDRLAEVPGKFLSAGQKRRVGLARIAAAAAPLWLLDEPTTALDVKAIAGLENLIAKHREGGGMVVVSTHTEIAVGGSENLDLTEYAKRRDPRFAADHEAA